MATQIIYKNIFGNTITLQQVQQLGDAFNQELYVDGILKRIDNYSYDGVINNGTYYLSGGEDLQAFLSSVSGLWNNALVYTDSISNGQYTVKDWEIYSILDKTHQGQTVYDQLGREIAKNVTDIVTGQVLDTTKTYYLTQFGVYDNVDDIQDFGTFQFDYNFPGLSEGEIGAVVNLPGYDNKLYIISNTDNVLLDPSIAAIFSWDNETYYHSSTPLIPDTTV